MSEATRLRLSLAYDGAHFSGWAKQPGLRTVQGELEAALARLLRRADEPRVTVAGRTDAGVHARGQAAHLDVTADELARFTGRALASDDPSERSAARARKLSGVLQRTNPDIAIWSVDEVSADFDARFSALWRRYEYRLTQGVCDPLVRHMTASVPREINFEALQQASTQLLGLRDFGAFCKAREGATSVRELQVFRWHREGGVYIATVQADAFCHSMVRALVGGVVAVATGRLTADELRCIADAAERSSRFTVMPAHGLSLEAVGYPDETEFAARAELTRARRESPRLRH